MPTFDVFEHTEITGGYQGNRFFTIHSEGDITQKEFKRIAADVSEEQARDLTACTPEICRVLSAIEEAAYDKETGKVDPGILNHSLFNVIYAINEDRKHRDQRGLNLSRDFSVFTPPDDSTERNRAVIIVKREFKSDTGSIGDLGSAPIVIGTAIALGVLTKKI